LFTIFFNLNDFLNLYGKRFLGTGGGSPAPANGFLGAGEVTRT